VTCHVLINIKKTRGFELMKRLKNKLLSLLMAISFASLSSIAIAAAVDVAIDNVSAKVAEASQAIDSGSAQTEVVDLIRKAGDLVKEIEVSDALDVKRQRANGHLKKARVAAKSGDLAAAKEHLAQAAKDFSTLKSLL